MVRKENQTSSDRLKAKRCKLDEVKMAIAINQTVYRFSRLLFYVCQKTYNDSNKMCQFDRRNRFWA
jgi:hypothetical protein